MERLAGGREEDRQRPAAAADHELHGSHVDVVDVGALFAVDLDVDEVAFISAAMAGFSKHSRSMTWHQ